MELDENRDKTRSLIKYPFRYRLNKFISNCLPTCCFTKKRYCTALFICSCLLLTHAMRTTLAVTAVIILDHSSNHNIVVGENVVNKLPKVEWSSFDMGIVHAAFYFGLLLNHIPAGVLATSLPPEKLFCASILITSTLNFFLPFMLSISFYLTVILRFLQGCAEAFYFPTSHVIIRNWSPPQERSIIGSIIAAGNYGGAIIGFPLSGFVAFYLGQDYAYYIFGVCGVLWSIIFFIFVYEKPSTHPTISAEELKYIEISKKESDYVFEKDFNHKIPWKEIFSSKPVWAINVAQFAGAWVNFLLLSNQPLFFSIFGYNIADNGFLASIPHIAMVTCVISSGFIADFLRDKKVSTTNVRKLMTCSGYTILGICLLLLGFTVEPLYAMIFITIGLGFSGLIASGWRINHQDIACSYSGVLAGVSSTIGDSAGILSPIIAGLITKDQTIDEWQNVFIISSVILFLSSIFYFIFASGQTQNWALNVSKNQQVVYQPISKKQPDIHETTDIKIM